MKPFPISVQLYSVRELVKGNFPEVLKKIADIGYGAVEFAGLHGHKPAEIKRILDDLGLVTSSTHGPFPTAENAAEIIDTAKTLGYKYHVSGIGGKDCETLDTLKAAIERIAKACDVLKGSGISFCLHNHWWEFEKKFDGKYPQQIVLDSVPGVLAQVDTYWVAVGGADVAAVLKSFGKRAPLLHIKDGPKVREKAMTAVGKGAMDWAKVIGAADPGTKYLIVELDRCDTDMMQAVADSYTYLTSKGFAKGKK